MPETAPFPKDPDELEYRERLQRALGRDYELRELIGLGGFGAVYAAWDTRLERDVAVKALRHDLFATPALLVRFQREAKVVAKLRHPNILPLYTVGEGDGVAFMVMPRVEGASLRTVLERAGRLPTDEVVRITVAVAQALSAAHRRGLVHRDVKPENIMLEGDDHSVLLMDFGIAKMAASPESRLTGSGLIVGSPSYMSPEQARGDVDIDHRSDLYALGAVAYEALTGEPPIRAGNLHALIYRQATEAVLPPRSIVPTIPPEVEDAVLRCLVLERSERWQSAEELIAALGDGTPGATDAVAAAEVDQVESWLGWRGPDVLVLLFLIAMVQYLASTWTLEPSLARPIEWSLKMLLAMTGIDLAIRLVLRRIRGDTWPRIARYAVGQPSWWQMGYPRALSLPGSVWDRMPPALQLLRTVVWLQIILFPLVVLGIFAVPTFQSLSETLGQPLPLFLRAMVAASKLVGDVTLPIVAGEAGLVWWLQRRYRMGNVAMLRSLLATVRSPFWQSPEARRILRD